MNRVQRWALRNYLDAVVIREDETLVITIKSEVTQKELEELADLVKQTLGEKVVIIGGVDKIIVAN